MSDSQEPLPDGAVVDKWGTVRVPSPENPARLVPLPSAATHEHEFDLDKLAGQRGNLGHGSRRRSRRRAVP